MNLNKSSKIYIAGHRGMVGSACWRILEKLGYSNLIGRTSKELDLRNQSQVGHKGNINWDSSKPDGTPRKLMDSSKMMQLGWRPTYNLKTGIANTYSWFLENQAHLKEVKFEVK